MIPVSVETPATYNGYEQKISEGAPLKTRDIITFLNYIFWSSNDILRIAIASLIKTEHRSRILYVPKKAFYLCIWNVVSLFSRQGTGITSYQGIFIYHNHILIRRRERS